MAVLGVYFVGVKTETLLAVMMCRENCRLGMLMVTWWVFRDYAKIKKNKIYDGFGWLPMP
jgi:hypothetical protein